MGAEEVRDELVNNESVKMEKEEHPKCGILLDIHTHHTAPQPLGVISLRVGGEQTLPAIEPGQAYSVGIHPWDTIQEIPESIWEQLDKLARMPEVVAVGEAGVDLNVAGVPLFRQLQVLKRQVLLSEEICKPLVIHNVKASDIIVGLKKDLQPRQNWLIHGFRGKPEMSYMLRRPGIYFSFGANFNAETLREMPEELILAETDESELTIEEIIARISHVRGKEMTGIIAENSARFLTKI